MCCRRMWLSSTNAGRSWPSTRPGRSSRRRTAAATAPEWARTTSRSATGRSTTIRVSDGRDRRGLRDILAGSRDEYVVEYPCDSPTQRRRFVLRVMRVVGEGSSRVVLQHQEVTDLYLAEEAARLRAQAPRRRRRRGDRPRSGRLVIAWNHGAPPHPPGRLTVPGRGLPAGQGAKRPLRLARRGRRAVHDEALAVRVAILTPMRLPNGGCSREGSPGTRPEPRS